MRTFRLPDLGEGLHEAEIVAWHVKPGELVKADDPLVSVETDKAVTEVPAPWTGRVARLCAAVGTRLTVGAAVVEYDGEGAAAKAPAGPAAAAEITVAAAAAPAPPARVAARSATRVRAMPAVRLLARELEIDLGLVTGTGPEGAVTARDVARAFRAAVGSNLPSATTASLPEAADWEPLRGPRRSMCEAMERSRDEVAPATVHDEADVAGWPSLAGLLGRLIRAICAGVRAEPALNGWFDVRRGRQLREHIDLGIAVDTPAGLLVPVLRGADRLSPEARDAEVARLVAAAQARTLSSEELKGATFTLSNFGSIAGRHATPVVVPPQVAILGAGRVHKVLRLADGRPVERPHLPLSLTIDHRAVTGGESARFLAAALADLALPG